MFLRLNKRIILTSFKSELCSPTAPGFFRFDIYTFLITLIFYRNTQSQSDNVLKKRTKSSYISQAAIVIFFWNINLKPFQYDSGRREITLQI